MVERLNRPRVAFFMEQHIGHYTYYQNLRRYLQPSDRLEPRWFEITYEHTGRFWERLPIPKWLQGTLSGQVQINAGMQTEFDLAFFNTQNPAAIAGQEIYRRPYVLSMDITPIQYDVMGRSYGHMPDRIASLRQFKHHYNCELYQRAACILPWSNWVRGSLISDYGVPPDHIEVVPPGVDTRIWVPGDRSGSGPLRILFVGGDLLRKGGDTLLKAFEQIPPNMAELRLVTHSSVKPRPGVTVFSNLQPNSAELRELYRTSDVFVLPTRAEAFGIAALEASASGLPLIVTATGGLTDVVVQGKTGYLMQSGDSAGLAALLIQLADSPALRRQMGAAGRARVEMHFDAHKNASRIQEILTSIGNHRHKK